MDLNICNGILLQRSFIGDTDENLIW